jgi:hypothetical protein
MEIVANHTQIFHKSTSVNMDTNFNESGVDEALSLTYAVSSAVNVGIFLVIVLPAFTLCLLCVVALFLADVINWPMRVITINLLAAEVGTWLSLTLLLLGFPFRVGIQTDAGFSSCNIIISLFVFTATQRYSATTLYAIEVYIFLKHGIKKVKWYVILPYIAISWVINLLLSLAPYFEEVFVNVSNDGVCDTSAQLPFFVLIAFAIIGEAILCFIVTAIFSALIYKYMKNNVLEDNAEVKRAVAKNLIYILVTAFLSFFSDIAPISYPIIRNVLGDSIILVELIVLFYICRVLLKLTSIITPISMITTLKPIRLAMKQLFQRILCTCRKEQDIASNEQDITS